MAKPDLRVKQIDLIGGQTPIRCSALSRRLCCK